MGYSTFQEVSCSNSISQLPCCIINCNTLSVHHSIVHRSHHHLQLQQKWCLPTQITGTSCILHGFSVGKRMKRDRDKVLRIRCCDPGGVLESPVSLEESQDGSVNHSFQSSEQAGEIPDGISPKDVEEHVQVLTDEGVGLFEQIRQIIVFAGPVLGIWMSGPIMSLIDTAVIGNSSSLELAALGPGTVFCDQVGYLFMFLSVGTSNLIAIALAKQDKNEAAHHLSRLLFIGLVCGVSMFILTGIFTQSTLKAFVGEQNASLLPAACSYVQIRGLAWPIVHLGLVAQSASLGMQDSWVPFKALGLASIVNACGDILFCTILKFGIAGAAWATMLSQYVAGYLMLRSLKEKGFDPLALNIPSGDELARILKIAAPVLLTMLSKVAFYTLATYVVAALGQVTLAAHQVMVGLYITFSVPGEPLSQTAQSFIPGLIHGSNPNMKKAQNLFQSLLLIGGVSGLILGVLGVSPALLFPQVFTNDLAVASQMKQIIAPMFCGLLMTPPMLALEGTLMAIRDLNFLSISMTACLIIGTYLLMVTKSSGAGLQGFWWTMASFQLFRLISAYVRVTSRSIFRGSKISNILYKRP